MPLYTYKVKTETGKFYTGEAKMDSQEELVSLLREKGYTPVEILEKNAFTDISTIGIFKQRVKLKDMAIFCRQFAIVLEAGVPISTAMDVLRQQTTNTTLREALNEVYENIQKGISLSNSMRQHSNIFPDMLVNMVEAGEVSGQLDLCFKRMADQYEKDFKLQQKVKGALTYPIIITVVAIAVVAVMMLFVVPSFAKILQGMNTELPILTRILISISNFFINYWYFIFGALILTVIGLTMYFRTPEGKRFLGKMAITIPVISGVTKNLITARLTRTLGTLMASGVLLIQSMEVVQKIIGNAVIADRLGNVVDEIKKGKGLTAPLTDMRYFSPMVLSMVRIGEESGNLDFALDKSADFYDEEVERSLQQMTATIEPVMMILMSVVAGFIVLSILTPMLKVYEQMSM